MARWLKKVGTSAANTFTYQPALTPGGGFQFNGAGGIDTLKVVLTAGEWASAAVQQEFAAFANFLANQPKNAKGEVTGSFTFGTLNIRAENIEKLKLVVAGKVINPLNDAPALNKAIADKTVAEDSGAFTYKLAANTFTDVDNATLKYSAKLADGSALPAWLNFNAATQTFSGTPPKDFNGAFNVKVTASDGKLTASDTFKLTVSPVNDAPVAGPSLGHQNDIALNGFRFGGGNVVVDFVATGALADTLLIKSINSIGTNVTLEIRDALGSVLYASQPVVGAGPLSFDLGGLHLTPGASYSYTIKGGYSVALGNKPGGGGQTTVAYTLTYSEDAIVSVEEGHGYALKVSDLPFTDVDSPNSAIGFSVVTAPIHGVIELRDGGNTSQVTSFTYDQVAAGKIFYNHNGTDADDDSFSVKVSDGSAQSTDAIDVAINATDDSDGFLGDTFQFSFALYINNVTGVAGPEKEIEAGSGITVDFTNNQIIVTNTGSTQAFWGHPNANHLTIDDPFDQLNAITGVTLVTPLSGAANFDQSDISVSADRIQIQFFLATLDAGASVKFDVVFG